MDSVKYRVTHLPFVVLSAILGIFIATGTAVAEEFPSKPITIIVPYSAGSNMTKYSRAAVISLSKSLGVPVVVKNVPGANGWNTVYQAKPDGYTLGVGDPTGQIGISMVQKLPYEISKFTWLGQWASGNQLLVAGKKSGFKSLQDLKNAKKPVRCGTFGGLSAGAVQCALLGDKIGFPVKFVNTKGPREVPLATLRGDVDIGSVGVNLWLGHIKKGDVTPIVVWSAERDKRVPNVDSLSDIGLADLGNLTVYRAVFTTPGVPQDRKDILMKALNESQKGPSWTAFITKGKLDNNYVFDNNYAVTLQKAYDSVNSRRALIEKAFK
jgi:tripartite-type tricarboxylate transporter receptor subunit TctC